MATSGSPWWSSQFSRVDNLGSFPDPAGNYYKPDSNIQLPPGYPIVAISPGTVTSVQQTSWGQTVVTVRLDTPINDLATHQFYEHMSSAAVLPGQHIGQGDLLGYNNEGSPPLGFGFYGGDVYGQGSAWETLQNDLASHGNDGHLSPVSFLDQMSGITPAGVSSSGGFSSLFQGSHFDALKFLQQLPGGLSGVPVIMGVLVVAAIGGLVYIIWKEVQ